MAAVKELSADHLFFWYESCFSANEVRHANSNTESAGGSGGGEGYKLENVDSDFFSPLCTTARPSPRTVGTAGGGDPKNLKCLGNSMHIVSGTEKRPIFAHRMLALPPSSHYLAIT